MYQNLFDKLVVEQHHRFVLVVIVTDTYLGSVPLVEKQLQGSCHRNPSVIFHNCKQVDHIARNCPMQNPSSSKAVLNRNFAALKVDRKPITCLIVVK